MKAKLFFFADILFLISILIFLSGGLFISDNIAGKKVFIEINKFGILLLPTFLIFVFAKGTKSLFSRTALNNLKNFLTSLSESKKKYLIYSTLGVLAFFHFAALLQKYSAFRIDWDMAIHANACSNFLFSSLKGDQNILSDHFVPALLIFSPVCAKIDPVVVLLFFQNLFFFFGSIAIFKIATFNRWSYFSSIIMSCVYLLFSGNLTVNYYDFHPISLSLGTVPWIIYLWQRKIFSFFWILIIFSSCLKENISLTILFFGIFMIFKREYLQGLLVSLFGLALFIFIMKIVYPYYQQGGSVYFAKYYGHIGNNLEEFTKSLFFRPFYVLSTLLTPGKVLYLLKIFTPFLFIHFLRPSYLIPILPAVGINILSQIETSYSSNFHYDAEIFPYLFSTVFLILAELKKRYHSFSLLPGNFYSLIKRKYRLIYLFTIISFFTGSTPAYNFSYYTATEMHNHIKKILHEKIEPLSKVAAIERVATHMTHLKHIYYIDDWQKADTIVVAYPSFSLWQFSFEILESQIIPQFSKDFELTYQDTEYPLFRIWTRKNSITSKKGRENN